jgi:thiamine transport system ATP-binding protein
MSHLEVRSLSYQNAPGGPIQDISFTVEEGRVAAVVGIPGSGTRAILRLIAGLEQPDEGDVLLGERTLAPIPAHRRGIGMVSDDLALFPDMDVHGNVAFGLRMRGWPRANRDSRVGALLRQFGLEGAARLRPDQLSATDRLRVALARALAPQPALLLLDHPLTRIDDARRDAVRDELRRSLRAAETTTVLATHDLRDATAIADDLVVMDEGRVLQTGPLARVLAGPSSVRVAAMVGYTVLVHGEVHGGYVVEEGVGAVRIPDGFPLEHAAVVLAHPSTLLGVPAGSNVGSGVAGDILRIRPHGPMHLLDVQLEDRTIEVRWEWDLRPPAIGTRVEIAARPGTLRFFNAPWPTLPPPAAPEPEEDEPAEPADEEPEPDIALEATGGDDEAGDDGDESGADADTDADTEIDAEPTEDEPGAQPPASAIPPPRPRAADDRDRRPSIAPPVPPRHFGMPRFD